MWTQLPSSEEMSAWPAPNYVNPVTRRPLVLGIEIPLLLLVLLVNYMRFHSRVFIVKALGTDDYLMAAATVCCCANTISMCISTTPEFFTGYHMWDIPTSFFLDVGPTGSIAMATQLMFVPITAFTKASVLFTYLRIFPSESTRYFCFIMLSFTAAWTVAAFCATLFQCTPVQAYWLPLLYPNAKCISISTLYYSTGIPNVVSDFAIFLWPAKDLGRLRVAVKQRVTLILMFCLGVVICAAGVCRLWYSPIVAKSYDILWHGATFYVIISIETSVGIICGCIPACRPLMGQLFPRFFSTANSSNKEAQKDERSSKINGQSFPFQSLSDGVVKSTGYTTEYEADDDIDVEEMVPPDEGVRNRSSTLNLGVHQADAVSAVSAVSVGSEEWICSPTEVAVAK